jgi:ribonuclease III
VSRKPTARDVRFAALEARIGHVFADQGLLQQALTHVSAIRTGADRARSYQRLEFLGDRVLGLIVARHLFARFPQADEGELSQRLADLVRKETCAEIARQWGVGPCLLLGEGEAHSGGRRKEAILGDACEALIGAIMLDGGFDAVEAVVLAAFGPRVERAVERMRDAKTVLQEWVQGQGYPTPVYREISRSGPDHAPDFVIRVDVAGFSTADGAGRSKRIAEQRAAEALLARQGLWPSEAPESMPKEDA